MEYDYESLENELRTLLESLDTFSDSEKAEVVRYVDVGEYGLALETVFDIALEESKVISKALKLSITRLAEKMGICSTVDVTRLG